MFIESYKKSKCINGCILFNDESNYLYWEGRKETTDELEIVNFINNDNSNKNSRILHVGIGNSYVASNINNFKKIDAITISGNELNHAKKLKINNYNPLFLNKLTHNAFSKKELSNYDIIIDVNLKSFSCCEKAFDNLFLNYVLMLNSKGKIITGKKGMNWSRILKPTISFSLKKLFHKKLKELDGPDSNKLKIDECLSLSKIHNMKFHLDSYTNIAYFNKLN